MQWKNFKMEKSSFSDSSTVCYDTPDLRMKGKGKIQSTWILKLLEKARKARLHYEVTLLLDLTNILLIFLVIESVYLPETLVMGYHNVPN